jgi:hypothetical protein
LAGWCVIWTSYNVPCLIHFNDIFPVIINHLHVRRDFNRIRQPANSVVYFPYLSHLLYPLHIQYSTVNIEGF